MSREKAIEILKRVAKHYDSQELITHKEIGVMCQEALAELEAVESKPEPGQKLPELASKEKLIEFLRDERYYHTKEELYALGIINSLQEQINRLQHALPPVIDWYSGLAVERVVDALVAHAQKDRQEVFRQAGLLAAKDKEIGLLKKAMLRYAHHEEQCEQYGRPGTAIKCRCGLEQALKGE
jgi:hypothetical protein